MSCKGLCIIFFVLCLIAAGCFSLESKPDPSRFYALTSLPRTGGEAQDPAESNALGLGIGPIKFPGYLDRPQLVTRISQNRFVIAENDRWAEPLDENFSRVLSQNLSILLHTDRVVVYPWERTQRPMYQLQMEVLYFEPREEQRVELAARWLIVDDAKKTVKIKESYLTRPAKDKSTEASVAALSEAVADLSREIANALREIGRATKPEKTATR
jgi:uncharacterized lipoprotein YmbA